MKARFHAKWCMPCKAMEATLKTNDLLDKFDAHYDVEEEAELAHKLGVRGIPALIDYDPETLKINKSVVGNAKIEDIKEFLES